MDVSKAPGPNKDYQVRSRIKVITVFLTKVELFVGIFNTWWYVKKDYHLPPYTNLCKAIRRLQPQLWR